MYLIKVYTKLTGIALVLILVLLFIFSNHEPISVDFLFWSSPEVPKFWFLITVATIGILVYCISGGIRKVLKDFRQIRKEEKALKGKDTEGPTIKIESVRPAEETEYFKLHEDSKQNISVTHHQTGKGKLKVVDGDKEYGIPITDIENEPLERWRIDKMNKKGTGDKE